MQTVEGGLRGGIQRQKKQRLKVNFYRNNWPFVFFVRFQQKKKNNVFSPIIPIIDCFAMIYCLK